MKLTSFLNQSMAAIVLLIASPPVHAAPSDVTKPVKLTTDLVYPDGKPAIDASLVVDIIDNTTHVITTSVYKPDKSGMVSYLRDPSKFATSTPIVYIISPTAIGFWKYSSSQSVSTLQPFTSVRIHLVDENGKAIAHTRICPGVFQADKVYGRWNDAIPGVWTQTTDSQGCATLPKLPQGYKLTISVIDDHYAPPDYKSAIQLANAAVTPDAEVAVNQASTISGTVLYGTTQKSVAGIHVLATVAGGFGQAAFAVTDKNGAYTITRLPEGAYTVAIDDYNGAYSDWVAKPQTVHIAPDAGATGVDLALTHGSLIIGTVTDKATGKPLAGIDMAAALPGAGLMFGGAGAVSTGADGTYKMRVVPGTLTVALYNPSNMADMSSQQHISIAEGETKTIDFQTDAPLVPTAIQGVVLGPDQKPVTGAQVTVISYSSIGKVLTSDSQGRFTIKSPGLQKKDIIVARAGAPTSDLATASPFIYNGESQITLQLAAGTLCTVTGQIEDQDGKAIPDAPVTLILWGNQLGSNLDHTKSDAQGRYSFPRSYGNEKYCTQVDAPGYASTFSDTIVAAAGQTAELPPIKAQITNSFVGGSVIYASGRSVPYAIITDSQMPDVRTTADRAGHFLIKDMPLGTIRLTVQAPGGDYTMQSVQGGRGDNIVTLPSAVNGIVLGPDGKPVSGAQVIATGENNGATTIATDASGRFTIDSPGLKLKDAVLARSGELATPAPYLYNGEDLVTLHLAPANLCTIKGVVHDGDGAAIANAELTLCIVLEKDGPEIDHTKSDAQGQFAFPPTFTNSKYGIIAKAGGYGTAILYSVVVAANPVLQVPVIVLNKADSFVAGTVVDAKGNPVPNATVSDNDIDNLQTTTDKAGHFMLKGVPENKTNVSAEAGLLGSGNQNLTSGRGDNLIYISKN